MARKKRVRRTKDPRVPVEEMMTVDQRVLLQRIVINKHNLGVRLENEEGTEKMHLNYDELCNKERKLIYLLNMAAELSGSLPASLATAET